MGVLLVSYGVTTSNNKTDKFEVGWVAGTGGEWLKRKNTKVAFNVVANCYQVPTGHLCIDAVRDPGQSGSDVSGLDRNVGTSGVNIDHK